MLLIQKKKKLNKENKVLNKTVFMNKEKSNNKLVKFL